MKSGPKRRLNMVQQAELLSRVPGALYDLALCDSIESFQEVVNDETRINALVEKRYAALLELQENEASDEARIAYQKERAQFCRDFGNRLLKMIPVQNRENKEPLNVSSFLDKADKYLFSKAKDNYQGLNGGMVARLLVLANPPKAEAIFSWLERKLKVIQEIIIQKKEQKLESTPVASGYDIWEEIQRQQGGQRLAEPFGELTRKGDELDEKHESQQQVLQPQIAPKIQVPVVDAKDIELERLQRAEAEKLAQREREKQEEERLSLEFIQREAEQREREKQEEERLSLAEIERLQKEETQVPVVDADDIKLMEEEQKYFDKKEIQQRTDSDAALAVAEQLRELNYLKTQDSEKGFGKARLYESHRAEKKAGGLQGKEHSSLREDAEPSYRKPRR